MTLASNGKFVILNVVAHVQIRVMTVLLISAININPNLPVRVLLQSVNDDEYAERLRSIPPHPSELLLLLLLLHLTPLLVLLILADLW